MLEREIASLSHFIRPVVKKQYFRDLPENIATPSAYFPEPKITGNAYSLNSYQNLFSLYIEIFHKDSMESYSLASEIVNLVQSVRNMIPLYDEEGKLTGKNFFVKSIEAKNIDLGVTQIAVTWNTHMAYRHEDSTKAENMYFGGMAATKVKEEEYG